MATLSTRKVQEEVGHRLHPIFHGISSQIGNRIDKSFVLPKDLADLTGDLDLEDLLDLLSEPPVFKERLCPVSTQIGQTTLRGKSLPDLMIKGYRHFARLFRGISLYVNQAIRTQTNEPGMIPFMSLGIDPDLWERLINADYDDGETTHATFMELFRRGVLSPCMTIPFSVMLPTLDSEFDIRVLSRIALHYHWHLLEAHHEHIRRVHGEERFVATLWLPEGAYSHRAVQIFHEEFITRALESGLTEPHLVLLLDNHQVIDRDNDRLMKSWNMIRLDESSGEYISVLFRDRNFSEWVSYSNPSVKKLLDRTIAKVDAELNAQGVDYCWSHFEELESLFIAQKAAMNFEQKLTKLTELGYLPTAPDAFVRRKMAGKWGQSDREPQQVLPAEGSGWATWLGESSENPHLGRWLGKRVTEEGNTAVEPPRKITRPGEQEGEEIVDTYPQCWKLALNQVLLEITEHVRGDENTLKGGVVEILASLIPSKSEKVVRRNVEHFLESWALCHWSEHFIQHEMSEAEINIPDLVEQHLLRGCKGTLSDEQMVQAATAAQAYYFIMEAHRSTGFAWECIDNRGTYQTALMASMALINLIYLHRWTGNKRNEKRAHDLFRDTLLTFENQHARLKLADHGIRDTDWKRAIKSQIPESKENVITRAAKRAAARHLRSLGMRYPAADAKMTTGVGHLHQAEVAHGNYRWDNAEFCGVPED